MLGFSRDREGHAGHSRPFGPATLSLSCLGSSRESFRGLVLSRKPRAAALQLEDARTRAVGWPPMGLRRRLGLPVPSLKRAVCKHQWSRTCRSRMDRPIPWCHALARIQGRLLNKSECSRWQTYEWCKGCPRASCRYHVCPIIVRNGLLSLEPSTQREHPCNDAAS